MLKKKSNGTVNAQRFKVMKISKKKHALIFEIGQVVTKLLGPKVTVCW